MSIEKQIDVLLKKMTLEEKIGQLNQIPSANDYDELKDLIKKRQGRLNYNGGYLLCGQ